MKNLDLQFIGAVAYGVTCLIVAVSFPVTVFILGM
jgi:hypothetical protein